ncbi:MAG: putative phenylacetic acid degradation-related protein [Tepidiforma sp.]|nr:PaaI family thioesterase [Tepidiforma sp.]GIW14155.1 MAG: putative phenylacetic acid degradation-related protein [Tepidiforma sp.]
MSPDADDPTTIAYWAERSRGRLPGRLGVEVTAISRGVAEGRLVIQPDHLAPNGYLHAATIVALADTLCGYGCTVSLPDGAAGFTTIELKANFLGTATDGVIAARAAMLHGGRTTQVWDAAVTHVETGRTLAVFRCTQAVLWPRPEPRP